MKKATKWELIKRWLTHPATEWHIYKTGFSRPIASAIRNIKLAPWKSE